MFLHKILILSIILTTTIPNPVQSKHKNHNTGPEISLTKRLSFPDFGPTLINQDITLLGSAAIPSQTGCIQIPENDLRSSAGRAIYSSPIRLFDPNSHSPASFNTTFSFQIHSQSNSSASTTDPASGGLSFIVVPDEFTVGRPGPWLGMLNDACDEYKVVAVEFDTRMNPEFGDPNDNHVGINLGSIVSTTVINASSFGVRLNDGTVHRAWINYDGNIKVFEIYLGPDGAARPDKAIYSGNLDLSPYLNEYMFIGFSGSTGDNYQRQIHSICSWNFTSVTRALLRVPSTESCASKIIVDDYQNIPNKTPSSFFIFIAVVILVLVIMINLYINRKPKENNDSDEIAIVAKEIKRPSPPNRARKFSLAEISTATRGFGELQELGSDSKSVTYKGTLLNGCNVVVKRFSREFFSTHGSDRRRMIQEIKSVGKIRHPNLVPIRGWCFDHQQTIVVYDFVPNGSLDQWLFGFGVLPWSRRFKIVKDVAEALSYLHNKGLAHKNLKPSSVFIDISFRAILGDFGFVLSSADSTRFESLVSQKVDNFEFGVLLLEVVSGRPRKAEPGELDLLNLAWAMHEKGEKSTLVDRRMGLVVNPDQAVRVIEVGLMCTLNDNKGRPSMEEVVEYLNFERSMPELPASRPVSLFAYSSTTGLCHGYSCAPFK